MCIIFFLACHEDLFIWSHGLFYKLTGHFAVSASVISFFFLINYPLFCSLARFFVFSFVFWQGKMDGVQATFCFFF